MGIFCKMEEVLKSFYYLKGEYDIHSGMIIICIICMDDSNGHTGRHIDRLESVHGGHVVGQRNLEG